MKNDIEIQQDVISQLQWEPFLNASNIGVSVKDGVVTLSGIVDTYAQKQAAEKAARKVLGVKAIAEDIQIGVSPTLHKSDSEIGQSVVNALKWHSAVPEEKIKIKVEDAIVTLEGEVEWDYQRNSAKDSVSNLLGVRNVINLVTVKNRTTPTDVKSKISAALHRTATVDAERISVEIIGSKVILRGKVRSLAEKEDAIDATWCAPGVSRVECYLEVEPQLELTF